MAAISRTPCVEPSQSGRRVYSPGLVGSCTRRPTALGNRMRVPASASRVLFYESRAARSQYRERRSLTCRNFLDLLEMEWGVRGRPPQVFGQWTLVDDPQPPLPFQDDGVSCGVFACAFAVAEAHATAMWATTERDINDTRTYMAASLSAVQLLPMHMRPAPVQRDHSSPGPGGGASPQRHAPGSPSATIGAAAGALIGRKRRQSGSSITPGKPSPLSNGKRGKSSNVRDRPS